MRQASTSLVTTLPDLTPSGQSDTAQINDITTLPSGLMVFDYFNGLNYTVYLTDGTASGTRLISGFTGASGVRPNLLDGVAEVSGHLVFSNSSGVWSVNEATAAATLLKSIGNGDSFDRGVTAANGKAYFGASGPGASPTLWATDGTTTSLVKTGVTSVYDPVTLSNGKLAFIGGGTVYVSNGTSAGTVAATGYTGSPYTTFIGAGYGAELNGALLFVDVPGFRVVVAQ